MVIRSEGWFEGGERKELTPIAKEELTLVWNMLLIVIRVFDDPTQDIPVFVFFILSFLLHFHLYKPLKKK